MKLSEINKQLNGLETSIGIIHLNDKIKLGHDCEVGKVGTIDLKNKLVIVKWKEGSYTYTKHSIENYFELVK